MSWNEAKVNSLNRDSIKYHSNADEDESANALNRNSTKYSNDYKDEETDENESTQRYNENSSIKVDSSISNNAMLKSSADRSDSEPSRSISPMDSQRSNVPPSRDESLAIPSTSEGGPRSRRLGTVDSDNTANESSITASDESSDSSDESSTENTESMNTEKSSESSPTVIKSTEEIKKNYIDSTFRLPITNIVQTQISLKDGVADVARNYIYSAPIHSLCSDISAESAAKALTTTAKALTKTAYLLSNSIEKYAPELLSSSSTATDLAFVTTALSDVTWTLSSLLTSKLIDYDQNKMTMLANAAAVAEARALLLVQSASKIIALRKRSAESVKKQHEHKESKSEVTSGEAYPESVRSKILAHPTKKVSSKRVEYDRAESDNNEAALESSSDQNQTQVQDHPIADHYITVSKEDETDQEAINAQSSLDSKTVELCEDILKTENYPESSKSDKMKSNKENAADKSEKHLGDEMEKIDQLLETPTTPKSADGQASTYTILVENGYNIQYTLGSGSFSTVKVALSEKHKCKVAVRIMTKSKVPQIYLDKFLPRVLKVVRILRHPNIVQFMQVIETTHRVYFIMEYAEHGSLLDRIRRDSYIVESVARKWFRQIAEAVNYLHEQGIVHRDIKCDNMLLDCYDDIKVSKFIFSRPNMSPTNGNDVLSETYCGTPSYAAPEILKGNPYKPQLSDIWSMGVVLFAMVYGRLPFNEDNMVTLMKKMEGKITFPSEPRVSALCRSLISRMLTNVRRRINISTVLCDRWCIDSKRPRSAPQHHTVLQKEKGSSDGRKITKIFSPLKRLLRMRRSQSREKTYDNDSQCSSVRPNFSSGYHLHKITSIE